MIARTIALISFALFSMAFIPASATADSIDVASNIIEALYVEAMASTKEIRNDDVEAYRRLAEEHKDDAAIELQSLNLAEKPGQRRFKKIYKVVDTYAIGLIESLRQVLPSAKVSDKGRLEEAVKKLSDLREERLRELDDTFEAETFEREGVKPVPLMDSSPYDKTPNEEPGMWFR